MDLRNVFDLLRHQHGYRNIVEVLTAAGLPQSRAYRRLQHPDKFEFGELVDIANHYGMPLEVVIAGPRSTMKWMLEHPVPSGDGPGAPPPADRGSVSGESSSACTSLAQVIPLHRSPMRRRPVAIASVAV